MTKWKLHNRFGNASSKAPAAMTRRKLHVRLTDASDNLAAVLEDIQRKLKALKARKKRWLATEARMKETADKAGTIIKLSLRGREFHTMKENLLKYEDSYFYGLVSSGTWMPDHNGELLIPFIYS